MDEYKSSKPRGDDSLLMSDAWEAVLNSCPDATRACGWNFSLRSV